MLLAACAAAAAHLLAGHAAAQGEGPAINGQPWRILLEQQLSRDKGCDLQEVLLFDEFERDSVKVLEGKISCIDGRLFDFVRKNPHLKFELDLCEPAVC
jgi:hypothetical protein